jgi:nucleoside-diphosphate-sugar epimerase
VARFLTSVLGRRETFGHAYNLCHEEAPTLVELLSLLGDVVASRGPVLVIGAAELEAAGLDLLAVSPFSGRWMSLLDPSRAREDLGFRHRPLRACLEAVVSCLLAHPPADRPAGYAGREREVALARRLR